MENNLFLKYYSCEGFVSRNQVDEPPNISFRLMLTDGNSMTLDKDDETVEWKKNM
jgi:hypothetical protein